MKLMSEIFVLYRNKGCRKIASFSFDFKKPDSVLLFIFEIFFFRLLSEGEAMTPTSALSPPPQNHIDDLEDYTEEQVSTDHFISAEKTYLILKTW
jgi:hypothetical protein